MRSRVLVTNQVLLGEVDRESLARVEIGLVKEPKDAVHLNQVLDILLFVQPL